MKNNGLVKYYDFPSIFGKSFLEDFFDNSWNKVLPSVYESKVGSVNIVENDSNYFLEISAPGFKKEEINVSVDNGYITITGEEKKESTIEKGKYSRKEFHKSSFKRSFSLPEDVTDDLTAKLNDGILTITLNKKQLTQKNESKTIYIE